MKPLTFQRKKRNVLFLVNLIKSYFNNSEKPAFGKEILKDQSFFSLIKNTMTLAIAHQTLKKYPEYQNSWLHNEIKRYLQFYKQHEQANQKTINDIKQINLKLNITPIILKEYNYKLNSSKNKNYLRFSNDVDILIKKSELFKYNALLKKNNYLLRDVDCRFDFKPNLPQDENSVILKMNDSDKPPQEKKDGINYQLTKNIKALSYLKDSTHPQFLEIHFQPNNYNRFRYYTPLSSIVQHSYYKNGFKYIYPEMRILFDASHFFTHFALRRILKNGLDKFLGHFQRLCDLAFNLKEESNINWGKLLFLAKKYNISHQAYGYLMLGKRYLNLNIPQRIIRQLKKESNFLPIAIINHINGLSILQDKRDLATTIYIKKYSK